MKLLPNYFLKFLFLILLSSFITLIYQVVQSDQSQSLAQNNPYSYSQTNQTSLETQNLLLRLTNKARRTRGLTRLILSVELSEAAQIHGEDLVKNQLTQHIGSDGSTPSQRAQQMGYRSSYIGENITLGRATAEETVEGWLNNNSLRSNVLNPQYTEVGFAYIYAQNSIYEHYWVMVLGKSSPNQENNRTIKLENRNRENEKIFPNRIW